MPNGKTVLEVWRNGEMVFVSSGVTGNPGATESSGAILKAQELY